METPGEEAWRTWGFLEKLDWAARENSRQGPRLPAWILAVTYGRFIVLNFIFLFVLYVVPSDGSFPDRSWYWQSFLRYTAWTYATDCIGVRSGPMLDGRFTPWPLGMFALAKYRLTTGCLKVARIPIFGSYRSALDVAVFVVLLVALSLAVFFPTFLRESLVVAVVSAAWSFFSDHQQFLASQSTTYFHVLLAGCVSADQGGLACVQIHVILIWLGSGLGKIGPWFAFVNGPFLSASIWLRGRPWLWGLLYQNESDLRPTTAIKLVGQIAPHLEWLAPLFFLQTRSSALARLGVLTLVAMHVYILLAPAARDVYSWNAWFIAAAWCLFGGGVSLGFDFDGLAHAPLPMLIWFLGETLVVLAGVLRPDLISYQIGHRNWAGNWSQAVVLLRKSTASKLTKALITYGRPAWDAMPEAMRDKPSASDQEVLLARELLTYKLLGNYWLGTLNLKSLPLLVQQALDVDSDSKIQDFYVLHGNQVCDMCMGSFCCLSWFPQVMKSVQLAACFDRGDFLCIHVGSFPLQWSQKGASWQILDAAAGMVAEGTFTSDIASTLSSLPSACEQAAWLLSGKTGAR